MTDVNQIIMLVAAFLTLVVTNLFGQWKNDRNQKHAERMRQVEHAAAIEMYKLTHQQDVDDRAAKAKEVAREVERAASLVRDRLDATERASAMQLNDATHKVRDAVDVANRDTRDRLDATMNTARLEGSAALNAQTVQIAAAVESAKVVVGEKAEAAYSESNHVNVKIEKLFQATERQGTVLADLLRIIERRRAGPDAAVPDAGDRRRPAAQEVIAVVAAEPISRA